MQEALLMPEGINLALLLAAALNAIIGVLHLVIIAVGPRWYRLFGPASAWPLPPKTAAGTQG